MTDLEQNKINSIEKWIYENNPSDDFLVQIMNLSIDYLNLISINEFEKNVKETYNGILKSSKYKKINIQGKKFIIDNY